MSSIEERLLIGNKKIRQASKDLEKVTEKRDLEALSNQQAIAEHQAESDATLREIRVHQKQLKSDPRRLETLFETLGKILDNQARIEGKQHTIIGNQETIIGNQGAVFNKASELHQRRRKGRSKTRNG